MIGRCPNCGAEFEPEGESIFQICKYCNASIFILPQYGGLRYFIRPTVDIQNVDEIIKDFFIRNEYTGEMKIKNKDAILYPFYKSPDSNKLIPATYGKNNPVLSNFTYKGGDLCFFKRGEDIKYRVLDPEIEPEGIVNDRVNIIYYPLIFVDYEYMGEEYNLIIDGFSREVIWDILPVKRDTLREKVYMYLFIITSFILFIEFYTIESVMVGLFLNLITLIIVWFIFPWVLRLIEDINVSENKNN